FGGPAWTRTVNPDGTPGDWYLHLFAPEQPDFNWEHPAVADEFRSILRFWLDMGVDGFRVDVAHGLVKAEGLPDLGAHDQLKLLGNDVMPFFDQDGVHEIYRSWRTILDEYPATGSPWPRRGPRPSSAPPTTCAPTRCTRPSTSSTWAPTGTPGSSARSSTSRSPPCARSAPPTTWVLSNHDVTRHATRFANPPGLGTQIRTPGDRELGLRRARAATLLMLALPGSAYVYQ
ncbi:alpha-glucosidase, partial [Streptomyces cavourensis]